MNKTVLTLALATATAGTIAFGVPAIAASKGHPGPQGTAKAVTGKYEQVPEGSPICNYNGFSTPPISSQVITAVRTTSDPRTYSGYSYWTNLTCADLTIFIPRGKAALVVATTTAELGCYGEIGSYCQGRILIDNVDSYPKAPDPSSFAWASGDNQAYDYYNGWQRWTNGTMTKSRIFTCPASYAETRCPVRVTPQVKLSDPNAYNFWVDEIHTTVTATVGT